MVHIYFVIFLSSVIINSEATTQLNRSKDLMNQTSHTTPRTATTKKWQVGRVTHKRYEIINVLWRKTKIFDDIDVIDTFEVKTSDDKERSHSTALHYFPKEDNKLLYLKTSTTPSNIEFYYSDLNDDRIKRGHSYKKSKSNDARSILNSPMFFFHVQYDTCKSTPAPSLLTQALLSKNLIKEISDVRDKFMDFHSASSTIRNYDDETCPVTTSEIENISSPQPIGTGSIVIEKRSLQKSSDDRIKFFEMYDSDTPTPQNNTRSHNSDFTDIDYNEKLFIEPKHVNINSTRYVKKHVDLPTESDERVNYTDYSQTLFRSTANIPTQRINFSKHSYISRPAAWSEFSFVAVYVYEPFQVRCDAAGLSPHWLLASGSCLSRNYKNEYSTNGQSAFVAYCTDNWMYYERITYVKHTFIHPRFDLKDRAKQHLYNIGVIQVVNSMSETCNGWSPVSLMSHDMAGNPDDAKGVAVGWGLDRQEANNVEIHNLMMYESQIRSDMCSGDVSYRKRHKKLNNVYCLSLPTVSDETEGPVHGALLLIGGKLIALYLKEERRPSGEQSALYTGVWRHIPWLLKIATEPEEYLTLA
ncbi:unnamed protein product [Leptosia nina]|uniref:Peptidase S1 domain-containing protein n=1 Tax=Leptosia nina TaxID=320188 RepID=A0AAV1JVX0_9NEOP